MIITERDNALTNDYRARPGFDGSSEVRLGHVEG